MTEEQIMREKPKGATHLAFMVPPEEEIEEAYTPPLRRREVAENDDLEEELDE